MNQQWLRKCSLLVATGDAAGEAGVDLSQMKFPGIDLSQMRIRFDVRQGAGMIPNHASIRVYNLSRDTVNTIRGREFNRVVLQAGHAHGSFGEIFRGEIKQYGIGKESATDSYLDIFAADGDRGYNFGVSSFTFAAGTATVKDVIDRASADMGMRVEYHPNLTGTDKTFGRSKTAFGMARARVQDAVRSIGATWSIQNGVVKVLPLRAYWPGEAVVITSATGMIGIPTQTAEGIVVKKLIDPRLRIGALVQINSEDINQIVTQSGAPAPFPAYNNNAALQAAAKVNEGAGLYCAYVIERTGDTHGEPWTDEITCLAVDRSSNTVTAQ